MRSHTASHTRSCKNLLVSSLVLAILAFAQPASAQDGETPLSFALSKDFGYSMGSTIQGTFSVRVTQREDLVQIALLIDGQQIGVDGEPPFRIQFSTSDFTAGVHSILVVGTTSDAKEIASQLIQVEFLSAEQARSQALGFVLPLLAVVLAVMALGSVAPALLGRGKRSFKLGSYGMAGGAVCPKCSLPFSLHPLSANLVVGRLERCPHCRKWSVVRRASTSTLEAAEAKYAASMSSGLAQSEDEAAHLRRMVDESRYESNE